VQNHDDKPDSDLSRRAALKTLAAGFGAAAVIPLVPAKVAEAARAAVRQSQGLKFFTPEQHRTVEVLSELLIPADDRSPGARDAKVADYIDFILGESTDEEKQAWSEGLRALDEASAERFGQPFASPGSDQQVALLTEASKNEFDPKTPLERFFGEAKGRTIHGYYTSEIGIHQELKYKGNQFLTEFVGCDHPEHMG
jgi:Gluconate 2-dehydrogenase subunit 3